MPETCPTCGQPWPNAMQPTDAIYWKRTGTEWKKLIGMGSAITPYHIIGAQHANILPGSTVEFPNGERAVVLKRLGGYRVTNEFGSTYKKEAICAILDRPVRSYCDPFVWDKPISFRAGTSYAAADIPSQTYIGCSPPGSSLWEPRVTEVGATLRIARIAERAIAKTYDPDDPNLFYSSTYGAFDGRSGMSGGPSVIDGGIASVHWTVNSDDFIGWRVLLDRWKELTGPIINGWTLGKSTGDLTMIDDGITFTKVGKHDYALTQPCDNEVRCNGSVLQFAAAGGDDLALQYSLALRFDRDGDGKADRVKSRVYFHRHHTAPGTVTLVDGANLHVSIGDGLGAVVAVDLVAMVGLHFNAEIIGLGELQLRSSGSVQGAKLIH